MSLRGTVGSRLDTLVGVDRTNRIRAAERGLRSRLASRLEPPVAEEVNPLEDYFRGNDDRRLIHKWHHYFDIYHHHFERFRDRPVTIVEFGVFHGGSLQMWRDYFGPQARIYGVDINPNCAMLAEPGIEILIGDQSDRTFLKEVAEKVGPIDVLIDDGGHYMDQQLATFQEMWPAIKKDGILLVEDLHSNYMSYYGGGYQREGTFIEFAKALIDQVHAWYSQDTDQLSVDEYTRSIRSMHVYDSIIVFDKGRVKPPTHEKRGHTTVDFQGPLNS